MVEILCLKTKKKVFHDIIMIPITIDGLETHLNVNVTKKNHVTKEKLMTTTIESKTIANK